MKTRFKSAFHAKTQPLCRNCARPIMEVYEEFVCRPDGPPGERVILAHPRTLEEAQKLTNYQIIRFASDARHARMTVWDGESYDDEYFCGTRCAAAFGRKMAKRIAAPAPARPSTASAALPASPKRDAALRGLFERLKQAGAERRARND